jgi:hypothetical protein
LPPAPKWEETQNENLDEIKTKFSKPLNAYHTPTETQYHMLLYLKIPDIHQLLACINPLGPEEKPGSETCQFGKE